MIAMYMYMYNVKTYSRKKPQPVNSKFQRPCISMRVNKNKVKWYLLSSLIPSFLSKLKEH